MARCRMYPPAKAKVAITELGTGLKFYNVTADPKVGE